MSSGSVLSKLTDSGRLTGTVIGFLLGEALFACRV
jgi:hypothetical protein